MLKLKLGGEGDVERVMAVRAAAPEARLIVDANEAWTPEIYHRTAPALAELGVLLIEQPFPADRDAWLDGLPRPIPLCADESCHDAASLPRLAGRFDLVNLKLDKTGGLTEALQLQAEARRLDLGVMIGCMVGTSLSMAPALHIAHRADFADLDGPWLLAEDRPGGMGFTPDGGVVLPADTFWGSPIGSISADQGNNFT